MTNLEQKVAKLEEKDTLQLAARLIAQDKYCRNFDTSLRWQNVSKRNTTDHDFTNRVQLPNTSDSYLRNRYELLIAKGTIAAPINQEIFMIVSKSISSD